MQLIDYHVLEVFEELQPFSVLREYTGMKHIGVRYNDMTVISDGSSRVRWCVTIERKRTNIHFGCFDERVDGAVLVLAQCLCGKDVKRTALWFVQNTQLLGCN